MLARASTTAPPPDQAPTAAPPTPTHISARLTLAGMPRGTVVDRLLVPGLLLVLALLFMAPGLPPDRVAAPMPRTLVYPPWHVYYPDLRLNVNPPIVGGDLLWTQLPWRHWMQQELAAGRFPLWASAPMGGQPLFASYQPGVLDPLHLLWVLLPIGAGLGLVMAFKLWLAGVGMWGFLLALGLRRSAALLGSLGFMFSAW